MVLSTERAPPRRKSIFVEVGLVDEAELKRERSPSSVPTLIREPSPKRFRSAQRVRFLSQNDIIEEQKKVDSEAKWADMDSDTDDGSLSTMKLYPTTQGRTNSILYRMAIFAFMPAIMLLILQNNPITGSNGLSLFGASGGVIPRTGVKGDDIVLERRDDTPTVVCKRWSHQSAIVNGTLYIYGGRRTTDSQQSSNEWVNDFLAMDLTKSWQISSPSLTGFPQPSGPPKVANGYLWNSDTSLYLYGGEFSEDPVEYPTTFSLWEYDIPSSTWKEHSNPRTSAGDNAANDGQPVQRAAEGAGFGVRTLGRGWYFGGHLDYLTTEGWSNQIARVYLKSLLEFTFPGYTNQAVDTLSDGKAAGADGTWRNITEGGLQDSAGFTERADGLLLYVPGFGAEGVLLGLTGGTNATFTQMNIIDVYDIANSTWYKQSTTGKMPGYRVNPCAVVAAAADGSSYNVYMFGGQNLLPYGEQTQYDDMWILSIPSFTWIEVDQSKQSVPYARAGHSCHVWDGQMIVIGGYVGPDISCESPGIYVFNMSSLEWSNQFTALTGDAATQHMNPSNPQDGSANPLAQQSNQRGFNSSAGLEGSYGYVVPGIVYSAIGGGPTGGATVTVPVTTATAGPMATGTPITYTVTSPNGEIVTTASTPKGPNGPNSSGDNGGGSGTNVVAIVVGVLAGIFLVVATYFAFCAWVYRKQLILYKNHAAMAEKRSADPKNEEKLGIQMPTSGKLSSEREDSAVGIAGGGSAGVGASGSGGMTGGTEATAAAAASLGRRSSGGSSTDDLLAGQEPTFWGSRGVLLNPRRSLRVINRD